MHIPDGFLSFPVTVATAAVGATAVSFAFRKVRAELGPAHVPLVGTTAAFVFAAQMINIPVAAGTSGHFLGATLATVLLGPAAAVVVMTLVLLIQALLFADGGVFALGANLQN
ncbi:MAG: energy-coupling factor ABC transporter permease, partial [Deltaproteobacteria bacterium]|nr:energy-coupling factor ABC transporter permease [Deltaproteobacteria bacterium]